VGHAPGWWREVAFDSKENDPAKATVVEQHFSACASLLQTGQYCWHGNVMDFLEVFKFSCWQKISHAIQVAIPASRLG
jgi:uncharacterized protein involved in tolerance to divalent cations